MALNLTPQYYAADQRYRDAKSPAEKLEALEEMLREIPKHKASEKAQAEIKRKISNTRKAVQQGSKKSGGHDPFHFPKSGAGQVVLLGSPNSGKSSIVGALTKAQVKIADYPFSTALPLPGMVAFEDVQIELVDTPPVTAEHVSPGFPGLWRSCDALVVVVDAAADTVLEDLETCLTLLAERKLRLPLGQADDGDADGDLIEKAGFVLAAKNDLPAAADNLELLREFFASRVRIEPLSILVDDDLARLPRLLFDLLGVIRVYAKPPGRKAEDGPPFVLPRGSTVTDMASKVHRSMSEHIRSARVWRTSVFDGRNVPLDYVLDDKDLVELHT